MTKGDDDKSLSISIPPKWGLSQLALHFEGQDLSGEADPFAANVIVQLRIDVAPGTPLSDVAAHDAGRLEEVLDGFSQSGRGDLTVGGEKVPHLEYTFREGDRRSLQQVMIYLKRGRHVYSVTGTQIAGPQFASVKKATIEIAASLL